MIGNVVSIDGSPLPAAPRKTVGDELVARAISLSRPRPLPPQTLAGLQRHVGGVQLVGLRLAALEMAGMLRDGRVTRRASDALLATSTPPRSLSTRLEGPRWA